MINYWIYGTSGNDTLYGTDETNDSIDGGAGADLMAGGLGDDRYYVDNAGDNVVENANAGNDSVWSSISYTLSANLENLILIGSSAINGIGNAGDNVLDGSRNSAVNHLYGGDGNDTYFIAGGDQVHELVGAGIDTIVYNGAWGYNLMSSGGANVENLTITDGKYAIGNDGDNVLTGNGGDNVLNGRYGTDIMIGGGGNDRYVVYDSTDVVVEDSYSTLHNNDADEIMTFVDYTISDNVENLVFMGANLTATGNTLDNTYKVGYANDHVVEASGGGTDTVLSSVNYTLDANVENLTLTGFTAINGTGNDGNNTLTGNSGINILTGLGGDDTYYIGTEDIVVEALGGGTDTIVVSGGAWGFNLFVNGANVENLTLKGTSTYAIGNNLDNVLIGNGSNNILNGKDGNDHLDGGYGRDNLWGLAGNDVFAFSTALSTGRYGNLDNICDFTVGEDSIELSNSIFSALGVGALSASEFAFGAGLTGSAGTEHIVYNTTSGMLYYDADAGGSGSAIAFAQVSNLAALTNSDFNVVA